MPKKSSQPQRGQAAKPRKPPIGQSKPTKHKPDDTQAVSDGSDDTVVKRRQQLILNIFRDTLSETLTAPDFQAILQQVKKALFDRDFDGAFNSEPHLHAYAARWSPTRALCYTSVLERIRPHLDSIIGPGTAIDVKDDGSSHGEPSGLLRVVAVGGAAAEIVAFGAFMGQHLSSGTRGEITLVDIGPWAEVVRVLQGGLVTHPPISKYASAAAREAAVAMVSPAERLDATFKQHDILALDEDELATMLKGSDSDGPVQGLKPVLVMINFTLNELFTAGGIGRTTTFLLRLSACIPVGSLLLVLDSPGSYSETAVGGQAEDGSKEKKKYPMQWMLHKILCGTEDTTWTRLETHDAIWFRLPDGLDYPIPLENMRYQMHLYRADGSTKAAG